MGNKKLYLISILVSILVYLLLISLLVFYILNNKVKSYDAMKKETTIELDLISLPKKVIKKAIIQPSIKKLKKDNKKIVKKSVSHSSKRVSNVKSLFGKTNIHEVKQFKHNILNIKSSMVNSRFKSKFEKEEKADNLSTPANLNIIKQASRKKVKINTMNENDPYYSKIKKILMSSFNPIGFDEDLSAMVKIIITNTGVFRYYILQESENILFNQQLLHFLETQTNVIFPRHQKGNYVTLKMLFGTENKGK